MPLGRTMKRLVHFITLAFTLSACHVHGHGWGIPPGQIKKQSTPAGGKVPPGQMKKLVR